MESFIPVHPDSDFPINNLPWGVFTLIGSDERRIGVAIGDNVVDITGLQEAGLLSGAHLQRTDVFKKGSLNAFLALGKPAWQEARHALTRLLTSSEGGLRDSHARQQLVLSQAEVQMHLPACIGDYTDFYASKQHATNVGTMFRGAASALNPNWLHLPVGYHGRASSILVSGSGVHRPRGQILDASSTPVLASSRCIDYELEVASLIGPGNRLGDCIPIGQAEEHMFGLVLMNDWSARDIQKWEYVPLGPFNGKNWATQISPWVVTLDALEPFRTPAPPQDPEVLPYLQQQPRSTWDVQLSVHLLPAGMAEPVQLSQSNLSNLYWTFPQMVTHHTVGGCNLCPGDLLGSGTISGDGPASRGCLLELTWGGQQELSLAANSTDGNSSSFVHRKYIEDGDTVILRGHCQGKGYRVGFGECRGTLLPCK